MWTSVDRVREVNKISDYSQKTGINRCWGSTWVITILTLSFLCLEPKCTQNDVWGHKNCSATGWEELEHFWPHSWIKQCGADAGLCQQAALYPLINSSSGSHSIRRQICVETPHLYGPLSLKCVFDGETIWTFSRIWDERETGYWGFKLYQKNSPC